LYEPTKFDSTILQPFFKKVHSAIREKDDKKVIFFEAAQFPDSFPTERGIVFPVGFTETPGGVDYHNRESLNDHTYCCQGIINVCKTGEPPEDKSE